MPLNHPVPQNHLGHRETPHQPQRAGRAGSLAPEHPTFADSKDWAWGPHSTTCQWSLQLSKEVGQELSSSFTDDKQGSEAPWGLSQFHRCWMVEPGPEHGIPTRTFPKRSPGNNQILRFWFTLSHGSLAGLASSQAWHDEFGGSPQAFPPGGTIGRGAQGSCPEKSQAWKQGCLHRLYTLNSRWLLSKQMSYLIIGA